MELVKTQFQEWLESKEPDCRVGVAKMDNICPIAMYLKAYTGISYDIGARMYRKTGKEAGERLPKWVQEFVMRADSYGRMTPVTARSALDILSRCEE